MARGKQASNHNQTQSTTIRDFFSPGSKKEAVDATRRSPETSRLRSRIPKNTEVIVIDSSDDECIKATSPRPRKKRRLSPESSDDEVEIVSFSRVIKESSGTTKTPSRTLSEGGTSSVSSKILLRTRSSPAPSTSTRPSLFGQPNHLLGGSPAKSLSFGPPSSLLMDCRPAPSPLQSDVSCDIDLSNLPEDEWGLGDDEMVGNLSLDDDNEENVYDDSGMLSEETLVSEAEKAGSNLKPLSALPRPFGPQPLRSCDGKTASNAFSVMMSSNKDKEAWNEATRAEDPHFRASKENGGRRKAPFYKVMNGMPIAVDAFRYGSIPGVTAYFLTHAHSDHYTNLSSTWKSGPIYCSEGTANLIIHMLSVDRKWVHPLPMDKPTVIPNTGGVAVTLIEANHCPGSCLFFFEGQQTVHAGDSEYKSPYIGSDRTFRYLHCGDFRACPQHVLHPAVKGKRIDQVYLDTTYLDPKYTFPPQPLVISACAELAKKMANGASCQGSNGRAVTAWLKVPDSIKGKQAADTLFVVGTYSIGKERIVKANAQPGSSLAVAHALQSKVYCDKRKSAILRCQADPDLHALLTSNPYEARVHLVPLGVVSSDRLAGYVERYKSKFGKVVAFRPTGWTYTQPVGTDLSPSIPQIISRAQQRSFTFADLRSSRGSTANLQLIPVPYSEHSSFFELTCFAMSFDWVKMIATVNVGSESSRAKMAKWVQKWEAERKKAKGKLEIVPYRQPDYW